MGDYFDDKEEENDDDDNEEDDDSEEDKEKKKFKSEYKDINEIIRTRNKINQEVSTVKLDRLERIGRIDLELFGNPESNEYKSRIRIIQEEISNPMTQGHPLVTKIIPVIRQIKELKIEQDELNKFYSKNFTEIAELLDNCIMMFRDYKNKFEREEPKTGDVHPENAPYVTEDMVKQFMDKYGNSLLDKYKEGIDRQSYDMVWRARKEFLARGQVYFASVHHDAQTFAGQLMDKYGADKWINVKKLAKKKGTLRASAESTEQNPTQPLPLLDSKDTNIPDNDEKGDEHTEEEEEE